MCNGVKFDHYILFLSFGISLVLAVSGCGKKDTNREETAGRTIDFTRELHFLTAGGDTVTTISVAVADEQSERSQGLMDVNDLPAQKGMLFIFEREEPLSFWMANTPLSLDIIFANADREIVRIHHNTQPFAEKNFHSEQPALYAVETNGGFCVSHDIQEGMKIVF